MRRALLALTVVTCLALTATPAIPAAAAEGLPQVQSAQLATGEALLDWGSRYQINVCDNHRAWSTMTLWVRDSGRKAWRKVGTDRAVGNTSTWAVQPAGCRYMANFPWTVSLPRKGFGEITFGYGVTRPTYRFSAVVANPIPRPTSPPAPAPAPTPAPTDAATSIPISAFSSGQRGMVVDTSYLLWSCASASAATQLYEKDWFGSWGVLATAQTPVRSTTCPADRPWLNVFGPVSFALGDGQVESGNKVLNLATGDSAPTNRFTAPLFLSSGLCQLSGYTC